MSAIDLKEQGNKLFSVRKYDDAISCYTKAIVRKLFVDGLMYRRVLSSRHTFVLDSIFSRRSLARF